MRSTMLAIAAAVALGTATVATGAMAAPPHFRAGPMSHPGPSPGIAHAGPGPGFSHPGGYAFRGRRGHFFGPGIGLYAYGGPCWVRRHVWTPFGWRWRLVEVC
jgi:hypothetical protein